MLSLGGQDKAPREEKKKTLMLFSSVSLMSCRHPSREGSVLYATPTVDPYSARCIQDKFGYSSSLRPSLLWNTFSFVFYGESLGSAQNRPAVELYKWYVHGNARNGSPSAGSNAAYHLHTQLKPRALRRLQKCNLGIAI